MEQGYTIRRVYDISQVRMKQPEPAEPKAMDDLMAALLKDNKVNVQVADNLPDNVQAQYIPKQRTVYVPPFLFLSPEWQIPRQWPPAAFPQGSG